MAAKRAAGALRAWIHKLWIYFEISQIQLFNYLGIYTTASCFINLSVILLAPAVTVGERRELWILPPFFFGLFFCL